MEALYHQTNGLLSQTQGYYVRLEQGGAGDDLERLEVEVRGRLDTLWANSERLEMLASKEPVARRQAARSRVDQLKGDIQHLGAALQSLATRREARRREAEERELLLTTEFTTNAASRESETSIMIDRALEHQAALGRTNRYMDDVLGQGAEILQSLQDQRDVLKGAKRKLLDVANSLGMSDTVIRLIERRSVGDKYILIGGMVATCVFMFMVLRYFT